MNKIYIIGLFVFVVILIVLALYSRPSQCWDSNTVAVNSCNDGSLRVVLKLLGGGYKIIKSDGTEISCPVIANPSAECMSYLDICSDVNLC